MLDENFIKKIEDDKYREELYKRIFKVIIQNYDDEEDLEFDDAMQKLEKLNTPKDSQEGDENNQVIEEHHNEHVKDVIKILSKAREDR